MIHEDYVDHRWDLIQNYNLKVKWYKKVFRQTA